MSIERKELIWKLRKELKTIPQICKILSIGKGTVGYYLKDYPKEEKRNQYKPKKEKKDYLKIIKQLGFNSKKEFLDEIIRLDYSVYKINKIYKIPKSYVISLFEEYNLPYKKRDEKLNLGRGKYRDFSKLLNGEEYLENKYYNSFTGTLKRYLYREGIKEEKCEECGIKEWNNKIISFDLEHIDGNSSNNLLENLRILCPNCHSQTPTYKGRNKGKTN